MRRMVLCDHLLSLIQSFLKYSHSISIEISLNLSVVRHFDWYIPISITLISWISTLINLFILRRKYFFIFQSISYLEQVLFMIVFLLFIDSYTCIPLRLLSIQDIWVYQIFNLFNLVLYFSRNVRRMEEVLVFRITDFVIFNTSYFLSMNTWRLIHNRIMFKDLVIIIQWIQPLLQNTLKKHFLC